MPSSRPSRSTETPTSLGPRPLVVGAAGQVGAALVDALGPTALAAHRRPNDAGAPVIDLAALAEPASAAAEASRRTLADLSPTAVFCVGGATDVERCEIDLPWAQGANCDGPAALAALSRDVPFVFFSTDYVFNGEDGPYSEGAPTHPLSVYGRSKLDGERAVAAAHPGALIVRTNVVYGPDRQGKNFLYTLRRLLTAGTPMRIPTDQLSTPTYNPDLARATVALAGAGHSGLFNISGDEVLSRWDFALLAARLLFLDSSLLTPVITADLGQRAARPLRGGLLLAKLHAALPDLTLHSNEAAILDWQHRTEVS